VLTLFGHDGPVNTVAFSPDGRFLATASGDGTVALHLLPIDELRDLARERVTRTLTDEECRQYLHVEGCPGGDLDASRSAWRSHAWSRSEHSTCAHIRLAVRPVSRRDAEPGDVVHRGAARRTVDQEPRARTAFPSSSTDISL
jgi:hypothetical protein